MNVFGSIRVSRFVVGLLLWGFWVFGRDLGFFVWGCCGVGGSKGAVHDVVLSDL